MMIIQITDRYKKTKKPLYEAFHMNWCRMAELNCPLILTMDVCYHYTNAACIYYIKMKEEDKKFMKDALCEP